MFLVEVGRTVGPRDDAGDLSVVLGTSSAYPVVDRGSRKAWLEHFHEQFMRNTGAYLLRKGEP